MRYSPCPAPSRTAASTSAAWRGGIGADTQHDDAVFCEILELVAEPAGLDGAAGGVVARIEVKNDVLAAQIGQRDGRAAARLGGKQRRNVPFFDGQLEFFRHRRYDEFKVHPPSLKLRRDKSAFSEASASAKPLADKSAGQGRVAYDEGGVLNRKNCDFFSRCNLPQFGAIYLGRLGASFCTDSSRANLAGGEGFRRCVRF